MSKIKGLPMPTADQIKGANASLRSRLVVSIRLAKLMDDEGDVALMQEDLDQYADSFGTYIALGQIFDQDVLAGFADLFRIIRNFNDDNREDNGGEDVLTVRRPYFENPFTHEVMEFDIPEPAAAVVKYGRVSDSTSAGSGDSDDHVNSTATHGGVGNSAHHYQALGGDDGHTLHLKAVGVTADSGGCCDIM